jgi:hypothetical protein
MHACDIARPTGLLAKQLMCSLALLLRCNWHITDSDCYVAVAVDVNAVAAAAAAVAAAVGSSVAVRATHARMLMTTSQLSSQGARRRQSESATHAPTPCMLPSLPTT